MERAKKCALILSAGALFWGASHIERDLLSHVDELRDDLAYYQQVAGDKAISQIYDKLDDALFWEEDSVVAEGYKTLAEVTRQPDMRVLDVALGLDCMDDEGSRDIYREINQANLTLHEYGLHLEVQETKDLVIPEGLIFQQVYNGLYHSFDEPRDYFLIVSSEDYSAEKDFDAIAYTPKRLTFSDASFDTDSLDELISREVKRVLTGKGSSIVYNGPEDIESVSDAEVLANVNRQLTQPSDEIHHEEERNIRLGVYTDGVDKAYLNDMIGRINEHFDNRYGITFSLESIPMGLPERFNLFCTIKNMVTLMPGNDVYGVITARDYDARDDVDGSSSSGICNSVLGCIFVEVRGDAEEDAQVLAHEIYHLFSARHDFKKDSIMYPYASDIGWAVSGSSQRAVLRNKRRGWAVDHFEGNNLIEINPSIHDDPSAKLHLSILDND